MIKAALDDAGLTIGDVDGVCHALSSMALAEYLRITPRWTESTMTGGSSFEVHAEHAAAAIAAGLCDVVVSVYASTPRSDRRRAEGGGRPRRPGGGAGNDAAIEFEAPYGLRAPIAPYALAANRHMFEYGTTAEQLAAIAVQTREWATMNPQARYREPITVDDVLASPYQVAPLHTLDCCLVTDGAGAFVMTSAERARSLRKPPVYVLGAATAHDHASAIAEMPDLTTTAGCDQRTERVPDGRGEPGRRRRARGLRQLHDHVAPASRRPRVLPKGEGGPFAAEGHLGPGGSIPMNTQGGGLSYTHPGMFGMFLLIEATKQLRGECGERQVDGAEIAVAHGAGFILSAMSTIVLGTEAVL